MLPSSAGNEEHEALNPDQDRANKGEKGYLGALDGHLHAATVRIVQTNAAGDSVMLIDPATNKVVGEIKDIEVNHGVAAAPDGSRLYVTNEAEVTLDVADLKTLKVTKHIPLTNHPNNVW